MTVCIYGDR